MDTNNGVWLGFKRCGCLVSVCKETGEFREHNDAELVGWLRHGLIVRFETEHAWRDHYRPCFLADCFHEQPESPDAVDPSAGTQERRPRATENLPTGVAGGREDALHAFVVELFNLVMGDLEWVRAQGGRHSVCPLCHCVCERDGGPGHADDCPRIELARQFDAFYPPAALHGRPAEPGAQSPLDRPALEAAWQLAVDRSIAQEREIERLQGLLSAAGIAWAP